MQGSQRKGRESRKRKAMEDTAKCEARAVDGIQGAVQKEGVISGLSL